MVDQQRYLEQVYAGVLGKIIGVYMGRPFEGWPKAAIEERLGEIDRYVAAELEKPLIVADDDISGTFTFIRALEDGGRYADTPEAAFGDCWLNYLIENRTVLWWGGRGHSTEHTAYLNLVDGIPAPESGSIARNGATVAEQIGAQIFIDAFGMVCPGRPELAAELAARSARVSHDGEAVYAAQVVAAMCAAAFDEPDLHALMDIGIAQVPADCLIAQLHRDVRAWCAEDGDWRVTFDRIAERYGYADYGGNCHVVPNHALMVMAWAYAPDDFHRAQLIVNTAGWDTDCNAANVGAVMGIALGRAAIDTKYDFTGPVADRLFLPTAEGTRGVSDALTEARHVAAIGRRIMGWDDPTPSDAWQDFGVPGAVQGWAAVEEGGPSCRNVASPAGDGRCLAVRAELAGGAQAIELPVLELASTGYGMQAAPRLWPGTTVRMRIAGTQGAPRLRLGVRALGTETVVSYGETVALDGAGELSLTIPEDLSGTVDRLLLEFDGDGEATALVDRVDFAGRAVIDLPIGPLRDADRPRHEGPRLAGWLSDADLRMRGAFSDDREKQTRIGRDRGRALVVTGTTDWADQRVAARLNRHLAADCGLVVRYRGRERWYALVHRGEELVLLRRCDGEETVLASAPAPAWTCDEMHHLELTATGDHLVGVLDGGIRVEAEDGRFTTGGSGLTLRDGMIGVSALRLEAELVPHHPGITEAIARA